MRSGQVADILECIDALDDALSTLPEAEYERWLKRLKPMRTEFSDRLRRIESERLAQWKKRRERKSGKDN